MKPLTVNEVLARLPELHGCCVLVEGVLTYEFECDSLVHWPKAECGAKSSLWMELDGEVFAFDDDIMRRWSGKRVVILGVIVKPEDTTMEGAFGCGHMGMWPGAIRARRIDLLKRWMKEHAGDGEAIVPHGSGS